MGMAPAGGGAQQGLFAQPTQSPFQLPPASSWTNQGTTADLTGGFGNPPSQPPQAPQQPTTADQTLSQPSNDIANYGTYGATLFDWSKPQIPESQGPALSMLDMPGQQPTTDQAAGPVAPPPSFGSALNTPTPGRLGSPMPTMGSALNTPQSTQNNPFAPTMGSALNTPRPGQMNRARTGGSTLNTPQPTRSGAPVRSGGFISQPTPGRRGTGGGGLGGIFGQITKLF